MPSSQQKSPGILQSLLELAYPSLCAACDTYTDSETGLCERCSVKLDRYELPYCLGCLQPLPTWPDCLQCKKHTLPLFALGNYVDPLKQAIAELKFRGVTRPVGWLCDELVAQFDIKIAAVQADCFVPIPLHPSREYDRGYNQAEIIALALGEKLSLPVDSARLIRTEKRKPQQQMKASQRAKNIRGVYATIEECEPARIVLVDDVVTSGTTVAEAARVLAEAGNRVVGVIALAHGA